MRTTVRLPDDLHEAAKRRAAETGRTFSQFLEDAVRRALTTGAPRGPAADAVEPSDEQANGAGDLDGLAAVLERARSNPPRG